MSTQSLEIVDVAPTLAPGANPRDARISAAGERSEREGRRYIHNVENYQRSPKI